jgi:hypothetical protein
LDAVLPKPRHGQELKPKTEKRAKINNKTIIGFGFRMTSRIIQTSVNVIRLSFASADNTDLGLNNS